MGRALRRLLAGRLLGMGVEGIATWVLLPVYGVPMAALLGLLTGLLAFLPNIGAPISGPADGPGRIFGRRRHGALHDRRLFRRADVDGNLIVPMIARKTVDLPLRWCSARS